MAGIDIIGDRYAALRDMGRLIDEEHRALKRQKLERAQGEFDQLFTRCLQEGQSISEIARRTGGSRATFVAQKKRLSETTPVFADVDPLGERYSWSGYQLRVTLTETEAQQVLANYGQHADSPPLSALFEDLGNLWGFVGQRWLTTFEHPVSLWSSDGENRAEMEGWVREHSASKSTGGRERRSLFDDDGSPEPDHDERVYQ